MQQIRVAIFDLDKGLRNLVRSACRNIGLSDIADTDLPDRMKDWVQSGAFDLAIMDAGMNGGLMCTVMRDIRHDRIGDNPFPVTIGLTSDADQQNISAVINAGFDGIVLKPVDIAALERRLRFFLVNRKAFVVTHDYIGPDRRSEVRFGEQQTRLISVPNPVRLLAEGIPRTHLQGLIQSAREELNSEKIIKDSLSIEWLVMRIQDAMSDPKTYDPARCSALVTRLNLQAQSILIRSPKAGFAQVSDLCATLADVAEHNVITGTLPTPEDIRKLRHLSQTIARTVETGAVSIPLSLEKRPSAHVSA